MKANFGSFGVGTVIWCCASASISAESPPPQSPNSMPQVIQTAPIDGASARGELASAVSSEEASASMEALRKRLADPEARAQLRAEQRASLARSHPDLESALGLDPTVTAQLLDTLTEQQLERMEEMLIGDPTDWLKNPQARADTENRRLAQLQTILGEEGSERYHEYMRTSGQRFQVRLLDARLAPGDKLRPEQQARLVQLLAEQFEQNNASDRGFSQSLSRPIRRVQSSEEMQRESLIEQILYNDDASHRAKESSRGLRERAAAFLTPTQRAELAKMQEEGIAAGQAAMRSMLAQAGITDVEAARALSSKQTELFPKVVLRPLRIDVHVTVNRNEPFDVSFTGRSGEPQSIEAGDGLTIELTSTLYEHDYVFVNMRYYETERNGTRRLLSGGNGMGMRLNTPTSRGSGGKVVTGRRAYAVVCDVKVSGI
jgi:hypothetical protein